MQLFHVSHGAGRPVIALHGFAATHYTWRHLVAPLSRGHELILFDLKGHGRSPKPDDGRYMLRDQAALVLDHIRARDLKQITLIGQSMGGGVALLLAERLLADSRDRLASLVLIASVCFPQPIAVLGKLPGLATLGGALLPLLPPRLVSRVALGSAFYDPRRITPDMVDAGVANFADRASVHALLASAPHLIPPDMEPALDAVQRAAVPVLLLWGRQDMSVPCRLGERLHRRLPNSRLVVIENCGHIPHEECPEQAVPLIEAFVTRGEFPNRIGLPGTRR